MNRGERTGAKFLATADPKISSALSLSQPSLSPFQIPSFARIQSRGTIGRIVELWFGACRRSLDLGLFFSLFPPPPLTFSKVWDEDKVQVNSNVPSLGTTKLLVFSSISFISSSPPGETDKISSNYFQDFRLSLPRAQTLDYRRIVYIFVIIIDARGRQIRTWTEVEAIIVEAWRDNKYPPIVNPPSSRSLLYRNQRKAYRDFRAEKSIRGRRFILSSTTGSELNLILCLTFLPKFRLFLSFLREKVDSLRKLRGSRFFSYEILEPYLKIS